MCTLFKGLGKQPQFRISLKDAKKTSKVLGKVVRLYNKYMMTTAALFMRDTTRGITAA